jgi:adenylosuccinate synthase
MIKYADVIVDLQAGDTGKGKVAHSLCKSGEYTHVIRYIGTKYNF